MNAYPTLNDVIKALRFHNSSVCKTEFQFVKPKQANLWESKMFQLLDAISILRALPTIVRAEDANYKFEAEWRFLYKNTTLEFQYDHSAYQFKIVYGLPTDRKYIARDKWNINPPQDVIYELNSKMTAYLMGLIQEMRQELPTTRFEEVVAKVGLPTTWYRN